MSDDERAEKTWSLAALKPGDEVGARWRSLCGEAVAVYRVVAIHEGGIIETDNEDFFHPDGREVDIIINGMPTSRPRHLCEPTDEGRIACLLESLHTDLDLLGDKAKSLPLDRLKELRETVMELLART